MGRIIILPEEIANRIAAGEVVERPSSVVKELVENSIDALSSRIEIELKNGGRDYIRVSDNGIGMSESDAIIALKRHSTSKIRTVDDLNRIESFGFRGEALPSIASVSRLELLTREKDKDLGTRIFVEFGEIKEVTEIGTHEGTTVIVSELFYNLPVRRKFLKSAQVELQHILKVLSRLAICRPEISFRLVHHGRELFFFPPGQSLLERLEAVISDDAKTMLLSCEYTTADIKVWGYISKPESALRNRGGEYVFVNGRPIESKIVTAALKKGYGGLIPQGRYPQAFIFIELAPELVDVNVHPAKAEVRFRREELVFSAVERAVSKTVSEVVSVPPRVKSYDVVLPPSLEKDLSGDAGEMERTDLLFAFQAQTMERVSADDEKVKGIGLPLFQVHSSYILMELVDGILIVDQHAAHERILYEQILERRESGIGKRLLFPLTVRLSPAEINTLLILEDKLKRVGFSFEIQGDRVVIESVPPYVKSLERGRFLVRLLQELENIESEGIENEKEFAAEMACKMAIKAGEELSPEEMDYIISGLLRCKNPNVCPHGRPTQIKITYDELDSRLKRR